MWPEAAARQRDRRGMRPGLPPPGSMGFLRSFSDPNSRHPVTAVCTLPSPTEPLQGSKGGGGRNGQSPGTSPERRRGSGGGGGSSSLFAGLGLSRRRRRRRRRRASGETR